MARDFAKASTEFVTLGVGNLATFTANTTVAVVRLAADIATQPCTIFATSAGTTPKMLLRIGNATGTTANLSVGTSATTSESTTAVTAADGWVFVAVSKATGTTAPRLGKYVYTSGTWSLSNGGTSLAYQASATNAYLGWATTAGRYMNGSIAAVATFGYQMTDDQLASLPYSLASWLAAKPIGMWVLDQASIGTPVLDWSGGGANQSAITGTSVSGFSVPILGYGHPVITRTRQYTGPNRIASYYVTSAGNNTNTLTTPSFTPANGEVLVVKMETWDAGTSMGSETGGSQTYTRRVTVAPAGFRPWVGITTATVSGSPGSMTVSATPSASCRHSLTVERWFNAQVAGTPATGSGNGGSGAANTTVTTTAANSVISWVATDLSSLDPATRAYLSSAVEDGLRDDHAGTNSVAYHAWQQAPTSGSQNIGLSLPTGMQYSIAGIEIQALSAGGTGTTLTARPGGSTAAGTTSGLASGTVTAVAPGTAAPGGSQVSFTASTATLLSQLVDNFNDNTINTTLWPSNYGTVSETGGRARIACDTGYNAYASGTVYTVDSIFCRAYPPAAGGATGAVYLEVLLASASQPAGTLLGFNFNGVASTISFVNWTGYFDPSATTVTYDPINHAWLKILVTGGNTLWQTSPDGSGWTTQRTLATPSWLASATDCGIVLESHRDDGTNDYAEIDNINVPGLVLTVQPGGTTGSGTRAAVAQGAVLTAAAGTALPAGSVSALPVGVVTTALPGTAQPAGAADTVTSGLVLYDIPGGSNPAGVQAGIAVGIAVAVTPGTALPARASAVTATLGTALTVGTGGSNTAGSTAGLAYGTVAAALPGGTLGGGPGSTLSTGTSVAARTGTALPSGVLCTFTAGTPGAFALTAAPGCAVAAGAAATQASGTAVAATPATAIPSGVGAVIATSITLAAVAGAANPAGSAVTGRTATTLFVWTGSALTASGVVQTASAVTLVVVPGMSAGAGALPVFAVQQVLNVLAPAAMAAGSQITVTGSSTVLARPGILTADSNRPALTAATLPSSHLTAGTRRGPIYSGG